MRHFALALVVSACVGVGAYLVIQGHPWFALIAMIIGGSVKVDA
jgi:hypothetical protein